MEDQQLITSDKENRRSIEPCGSEVSDADPRDYPLHRSQIYAGMEPTLPLVPLTRRDVLTLASVFVGMFFGSTVMSLQAPLYPPMATVKGLTSLDTGIVFGMYSVFVVIIPPFAGVIAKNTSTKFVMASGCLIVSVTTLLFGFLEWSPPASTFLSLSIALRVGEGIGMSFFVFSAYSYVTASFPTRFAPLVAAIELIFAVSACVGPVLGGFLNEVGGFLTPFALVGGMTFLSGIFIIIFFNEKTSQDDDDRPVGMLTPLKYIAVCLHMTMNLVACTLIGFNITTLTYYLLEVDPSIAPSTVGLIFFSSSVAFGLTSQLTGIIINKLKRPYCLSHAGIILCAVGFVFSGPMWPINIPPSIWLIIVSQIVFGIGYGFLAITSVTLSFQESYAAGLPQGKGTNSAVSSVFVSGCGLGFAIGSFGGGALYHQFGYVVSTTYVVGYILLNFLFLFVFTLSRRRLSVNCDRETNLENEYFSN